MANIKLQAYEKDPTRIIFAINQLSTKLDALSSGNISSGVGVVAGSNSSGQLTATSSTTLQFAPYNGNGVKVSGTIYQIPNAGIAGLGNTGVYVEGTPSSNLAINKNYYVYCWNNGGTPTADFSALTAYAISTTTGNEGTFIKSGDDSRSLIGLIRTNASAQFVDTTATRYVRSWFNPLSVILNPGDIASGTFAATSAVALGPGPAAWVQFAADTISVAVLGNLSLNAVGAVSMFLYVDGTRYGPAGSTTSIGTANFNFPVALSFTDSFTEGQHTVQLYGLVSTGTCTLNSRTTARLMR